MQIINCTPHPISIVTGERQVALPPSGVVPRMRETCEAAGEITLSDGIMVPIRRVVYGPVEGLPAPQADTIFVVSALVAQAAADRPDLAYPGDFLRDEAGRIIGCRALYRVR